MAKPLLYAEDESKEAVKECLLYILESTLRWLHPLMPYVTEEIWQRFPGTQGSIMVAEFPEPSEFPGTTTP